MYCNKCGNFLLSDETTCNKCGCIVSEFDRQQARVEEEKNSVSEIIAVDEHAYGIEDDGSEYAKPVLRGRKKAVAIFLGLSIAEIILFAVYAFFVVFARETFMVSIITALIYAVPLAWMIPLTSAVNDKLRRNIPIGIGLKICALLFVNIIGGIILLTIKN